MVTNKNDASVVGGPKDGLLTQAYGTFAASEPLKPLAINRRYPLKEHDILVDILYCGICHSDIHCVRSEWPGTTYPVVPGHEITGIVKEIGSSVTKLSIGDKCGVGVYVNSCHKCRSCTTGLSQYCEKGMIQTYNCKDNENEPNGGVTYGGYSTQIVVNENYVLKWPENLSMLDGAPLLCAGIGVYSPMKYCGVTSGSRVGVVGLGGVGHIAVRMACALGATVSVLSRAKSEDKKQLALNLGASEFIETKGEQSKDLKCEQPFDLIIDTVSEIHDINRFLNLLKVDGTYALLGLPARPLQFSSAILVLHRIKIIGSAIGSIEETQEMLDFCASKNVVCTTETVKMSEVNEAYNRVVDADVKFRFVIDMKNSTFDA